MMRAACLAGSKMSSITKDPDSPVCWPRTGLFAAVPAVLDNLATVPLKVRLSAGQKSPEVP